MFRGWTNPISLLKVQLEGKHQIKDDHISTQTRTTMTEFIELIRFESANAMT